MYGPTVRLERLTSRRADEVAAAVAMSLPELKAFMDWAQSDPDTPADFEEFFGAATKDWDEHRGYGFHVLDETTGEIAGGCGLMRRVGPRAIEIGYWIRTDMAGNGLATETAAILVEAAWTLSDVDRIEIQHDSVNHASARVAEKLGFVEFRRRAVQVECPGESGVYVDRELHRPPGA